MNDRDIEDTRIPKDEPEAVFCDGCGEEFDYVSPMIGNQVELVCNNYFCPDKFEGIAKEMAELIVEQKDTIERLEKRVKFLVHKVEALEFQRDEK